MNLETVYCDTGWCPDKHKRGAGNIVAHDRKRQRCKCKRCGRTFSYRSGTPFMGLRTPPERVMQVVTLISYGCPIVAIEAAFGLDRRTVRSWLERTGRHAEIFHHQQMRRLDLQQVQVDEIRLKMQGWVLWVAMAIAVGSRLWLGAVSRQRRDKQLARQIMTCVYNWACQLPLVISFDGWAAYPKACRKTFREPHYTGRAGGPRLIPWPQLTLVQFVKRSRRSNWSGRRWVLSGSCTMFLRLLQRSQGAGTINTAYIERLFATFRARLSICTRRSRHSARHIAVAHSQIYLVGCLYNFCRLHASLRDRTPAMAAGLTDHCWSIQEFFWWRLHPYRASTV